MFFAEEKRSCRAEAIEDKKIEGFRSPQRKPSELAVQMLRVESNIQRPTAVNKVSGKMTLRL